MLCKSCSRELPDETRFCPYCGEKVAVEPPTAGPPSQPVIQTPPPQPLTTPAYTPPGGIPSLEKAGKSKRNKLLLIGIPSLVLVVGIILVLLFVFVFGGGMSPKEYQEKVSPIHDEFMSSMEEVDKDLTAITVSDTDITESGDKIESVITRAIDAARAAEEELDELTPPKETAILHQDLLDYYRDVQASLEEMGYALTYVLESVSIWEEWMGIPYAVDKITEGGATPEEFSGLIQQDMAFCDACKRKLEALTAPELYKDQHQSLLAWFEEEYSVFQQAHSAIASGNYILAEHYLDLWSQHEILTNIENVEYLLELAWQYSDLMDKGFELEDEIAAIK